VGIGFAFGRISPQAAASDRDLVALTGTPMPIRDYEAAVELTYQVQLAQDWSLQPDLQYIIHAGGHVTESARPERLADPERYGHRREDHSEILEQQR
jgi:porin